MAKTTSKIQTCTPGGRRIAVGVLGCLFAICGLVSGILWERILNSMLDKGMTLRPNSRVFDFWKSPPLDVALDMYLYNWTNPEDFRNLSTKPILKQVGPYRFSEFPNKVDIQWHPENASVSYRRQSHFIFNAEESQGSLTDQIVTLNPVAVAASGKAKHWNPMRRTVIDIALKVYGNDVSITKSVDELLFNGYADVLLDFLNAIPTIISDIDVPFDKFGYCYKRNGSSSLTGLYNIFTGADDISKIGQINTWNHKKRTGKFGPDCGWVNGSAGEFQPPNLKVNSTAHIFIPELCRSMPMEYVKTTEVEGVRGFKYVAGLLAVDNGTIYPENKCYCAGQCVPSGVMNVSACWYDAPIFMSYPHFYNADSSYIDAVEGLQPNQKDHECYVVLEPRTGFILDVAARLQVNLLVEPVPYLNLFRKVPRIFFPLMWFEQKIRVTPELASELKMMPLILLFARIISGCMLFLGIGLMAWYRMDQVLHKARCIDLKLGSENSVTTNAQLAAQKLETEQAVLRDDNTKRVAQSQSIDSGCQHMDTVSNASKLAES